MLIKTTTIFEKEEQKIFGSLKKWLNYLDKDKISKFSREEDLKFARHLANNEHVNWDNANH